jgi:pyrroline-5-carboxylate reductase
MGIAILSGIMAALTELSQSSSSGNHNSPLTVPSGISTPAEEIPARLPSRFYACVRRPASAKRIQKSLANYPQPLEVMINDNVTAVQAADIVLLGCKPQMFRDIVRAEGMHDALRGKLLVSILAGVTNESLEAELAGPDGTPVCRVVRAMPNTAAFVRESMTVIGHTTPPLEETQQTLVTWIFNRVGRVVHLPPSAMDASTAVCGSGPAFMALVMEAMADGGVAMGLPRAEAQFMAAQTMRGASALVLEGEHPAILRDKVSTPGGCTIGGLLVLEEGTVRGAMARAVREATVVAAALGTGAKGVNGTRF